MQKKTITMKSYINRPIVDWVAMKVEAFKRLDENNRLRDGDESFREIYPRIGEQIYRTVEKLMTLYRKKWNSGQLDSFKFKFTYSYFKQHADSRYCIRTFINHFNKLEQAYMSIFRIRNRATLQLPDRDCNCVMIEFAPGIVQFTNPTFNKLADMSNFSPPPDTGTPHLQLSPRHLQPNGFNMPPTDFRERRGETRQASDLIGSLLKGR